MRMPGYSLPKRTPWHWFIVRKEKGAWFSAATGSLFNTITDHYRDPGTRLFIALRHKEDRHAR